MRSPPGQIWKFFNFLSNGNLYQEWKVCLVESGTRICQSVTPLLSSSPAQTIKLSKKPTPSPYPPNCLLCIPLLTHQHHVTLDMAIKRHLCQKVFARSKKRNCLSQNKKSIFTPMWAGGDIGLEKYEGWDEHLSTSGLEAKQTVALQRLYTFTACSVFLQSDENYDLGWWRWWWWCWWWWWQLCWSWWRWWWWMGINAVLIFSFTNSYDRESAMSAHALKNFLPCLPRHSSVNRVCYGYDGGALLVYLCKVHGGMLLSLIFNLNL